MKLEIKTYQTIQETDALSDAEIEESIVDHRMMVAQMTRLLERTNNDPEWVPRARAYRSHVERSIGILKAAIYPRRQKVEAQAKAENLERRIAADKMARDRARAERERIQAQIELRKGKTAKLVEEQIASMRKSIEKDRADIALFKATVREAVGPEMYAYIWQLVEQKESNGDTTLPA